MKKTKFILITIILHLWMITPIFAQNANPDFMHSIGKIYVVVAVILTIFIGIIIYLISLEKKIKKLENQIKE